MKDIVVIGAGIVGLAAALQLRRDGHRVTLLDPNPPASGCSSGNAGYLSLANIFPPTSTESLGRLPRMLSDPMGPLAIRLGHVPRFLPWGVRAAIANRPRRLLKTVDAMAALILRSIDSYEELLREAGIGYMLDRRGAMVVCRTQAMLRSRSSRNSELRAHGIEVEIIPPQQVFDMEPAIARDIVGAIHYPGAARCVDPYQMGEKLAQYLVATGAEILPCTVRNLTPLADGSWQLATDSETLRAARVVVSAGSWSGKLLKPLGFRVPLEAERGYHLMLPTPGITLHRPVSMAEAYFVATPMLNGLRLAGTAEFAGLKAPMNMLRATMMLQLASPFLPGLCGDGAVPWMGMRPSLPDGLPAVGRAAGQRNLFYCFGHNHNGLMQAAISGRLLADIVADRKPVVDPYPYRLERFFLRASKRNMNFRETP